METRGLKRDTRREPQDPDPLNPKGSATRKSQTSHSALTYWSGIIWIGSAVKKKIGEGWATRQGSVQGELRRRTTVTEWRRERLIRGARREPQNRDPFETERVGHPERLNPSLGVDVLEWYHPMVRARQQKKHESVGHPPSNGMIRSFVVNANAGVGVVAKYFGAGGK
jgi:hypothetical protein